MATLKDDKEENPAISRMMKIAKPEWPGFALGLTFSILSVFPEPLGPYFLSEAIHNVSGGFGAVCVSMRKIVFVALVGTFLGFLKGFIFAMIGERIVLRLRQMLYEAIMIQDVSTNSEVQTGEYISRMTNDVWNLQNVFSVAAIQAFTDACSVVVILTLMLTISWQLTMVGFGTALCTSAILIPAGALQGRFVQKYQDALAKTLAIAQESLASFTTVRSFAAERYSFNRYRTKMGDLQKARCWWITDKSVYRYSLLRTIAQACFTPGTIMLNSVIVYGSLWYALYLCTKGKFSPGLVYSFILYSFMLQGKMGSLGNIFGQVASAKVAATRIFNIVDMKPLIAIRGGKRPESMIGDVVFKDVCFEYPGTDKPVLAGLNCRIPPRTSAAFVGHSGAGKSTTLRLLERFYDVSSGSVTIDGHDLRDLDGCWLRNKLAFVQQEPNLFDMSIRENISYSYLAAKANLENGDEVVAAVAGDLSEDMIHSACKRANALDFILALQDGFDTKVGEAGARLSGGQKQRVAIARAILADPTIMLLDEATSALDAESEALVQQALDNMMQGRTVLMVAHRLSTVKDATAIHFMKDGVIEASGPFDELLKKSEGFASLVQHQLTDKG